MKLFCIFCIFSFQVFSQDLSLTVERDYLSPNNDGFNDRIEFNIQSKNDKKIIDWTFKILDESGNSVKIFSADSRKQRKKFFLFYLFTDDNEFEIPEIQIPKKLIWLGTDNKGKIVPDGRYNSVITIKTDSGSDISSNEVSLYLDSNPPKGEIRSELRYFSPNKDKQNDVLTIKQSIKSSPDDKWKGVFYNYKNEPIKIYYWDAKNVPSSLVWDGKNERGITEPTGLYHYELIGEDKAKNISVSRVEEITLDENGPGFDIFSATYKFSPDGDGVEDFIKFITFLPPKLRLQNFSYRFSIFQKTDKENILIWKYEGQDSIPEYIIWDGKDSKQGVISDGVYHYNMGIEYSGNKIFTIEKSFQIKTKKTALQLKIEPENFTPDYDKNNDTVEFQLNFYNRNINQWRLDLSETYIFDQKKSKKLVKTWKGEGNPGKTFFWEGFGDDQLLTGSLSEHVVEFAYTDEFSVKSEMNLGTFTTGICVMPEESGALRISIPESKLLTSESGIFNEIKKKLKLFPGYKIEVQSHSSQKGDNVENLKKTEMRAKSVFKHLFGKEHAFDRFSFRGAGEIEPLLQNGTEYSEDKNNRIDILLTLK